MIQHYNKHGIKVGLSTDKFNKWLKKPYLKSRPPRGNQSADWDYTSLVLVLVFILRAPGRNHLRDRWVHLKHRLSKREYRVVLSKTYGGAIVLMHMFQGKGRWGSKAEVPALTLGKKRTRVHYMSPTKYTTMVPLSTSHEKARHSTHA